MQNPEQQIAELQKELAEKNRELEIEVSLETVRTRAMEMNKPDDLLNICEILFKQLKLLGFTELRNSMVNIHNDDNKSFLNYDYSDVIGKSITPMNYNTHPVMERQIMQSRITNDAFSEAVYEGKDLEEWKEFRKKYGEKDDPRIDKIKALYYYFYSIGTGTIGISTFSPISEEKLSLLKRFRNVFNLAYKRYIDISLADAQVREAQIQLALERVRARTMAMHKSDELSETSFVLFEQLKELGEKAEQISIMIYNEKEKLIELYATIYGKQWDAAGRLPFEESPVHKKIFQAWKQKQKSVVVDLTGEKLTDFNKFKMKYSKQYKSENELPGNRWVIHNAFFSKGAFTFSTHEPRPPETIEILERFAGVFDLTYTRFLDLQKAEAQAREARIEAALERVRAQSMAMHKSDELFNVIRVVSEQLQQLGFRFDHVSFAEANQAHDYKFWLSAANQPQPYYVYVPYINNPMFERVKEAQQKGLSFYSDVLTPEENRLWHKHVFDHNNMDFVSEERREYIFTKGFARSIALLPNIMLIIGNYDTRPYSEEENKIINRFAAVFQQSYTRFLDLQKAEAQAREAKIEASLERVRAKALAMNSSEDFMAAISVFYHELSLMSHIPRRCGVGLISKETRLVELSTFNTTTKGGSVEVIGKIKMEGHPVLNAVYENWLKKREYHVVLRGNEIKEYYRLIRPQILIPDFSNDQVQYGYFFYFDEGGVYTWTEKELSEDELKIYRRFTGVFSLAHKRYLDIKEAEARTIEAVRQASLDRIRAEIASMRTAEDLNRITPVIWRELTNLEVPFIRCGVFIIDELQELTHVYLSTPDGKSLGVLCLPFEANELVVNTVNHWREKKVYKEHWNKEEFIRWTKSMIEIGQVKEAEINQASAVPPDSLFLHLVPFRQGMLYVGNISPLTDEKLGLVKSLAEAFSIAYARYEDFHRVESAFKELDKLSKELKVKNEELENENERKAAEMEEARELQLAMLPKQIPEHPDLDIKVFMQTATEVGGDYYDFSYSNDGSINIAIGDATGHGMKAGTLVTMLKSLFIANSSITGIEAFFNSSNSAIKNSNLKRMLAAFAMLNIKDHKAKFINAGMPPLYHYIKKENEVKEIKHFNLPLGATSLGNYKSVELDLNTGDLLVMMSDGFPELRCDSDDLFGYERVYSSIQKAAGKEPAEIISHFKNEADCWSENKEPEDDITFVVIKVK